MKSENELSRLLQNSHLLSLILIIWYRLTDTCFWKHRLCQSGSRIPWAFGESQGWNDNMWYHCPWVSMKEGHVNTSAGNVLFPVFSRIITYLDASLHGEPQCLMSWFKLTCVPLFLANHFHVFCFAPQSMCINVPNLLTFSGRRNLLPCEKIMDLYICWVLFSHRATLYA